MDKIQVEIFEKKINKLENPLKCSICKNYLSVAPIHVNTTFGNICGRKSCEKFAETEGTIRLNAYEALAMSLEFPCCNKENGCDQILPWDEIAKHEEACEFGCLSCPYSFKRFSTLEENCCEWNGDISGFLEHMREHHRDREFEYCFTMDVNDPVKNNQVFFSVVNDDIVAVVVLVDSYSVLHWNVYAGLNIVKDMKYRFAFLSEKEQSLMTCKFKRAHPIRSAFYKMNVDNSWFRFDCENSKNSFDTFRSLVINLFIHDIPLTKPKFIPPYNMTLMIPQSLSPFTGISFLELNNSCGSCKKFVSEVNIPFICLFCFKTQEIYCQMCITRISRICYTCKKDLKMDIASVCRKSAADPSLKICICCYIQTDSLLSHVLRSHKEFFLKLGQQYHFCSNPNKYFFFYDDNLFLLSYKFNSSDISFSVIGSDCNNIKYKYELTLTCSQSNFSGITLRGYCIPELVYLVAENSNISDNETIIPYNILQKFASNYAFKFKLNITTI